jgi:hypothetical protein
MPVNRPFFSVRFRSPLTFATAALASVWLCSHFSIRAAEATTPLFNPDPQHISNRLYRQLHVRADPAGKEHGFDAVDPLLWSETTYLLIGKSHTQALALADEFPAHDLSFTARSVFFVFARLPGGRDATLAYFKQLAEMKTPLFVRMQDPGWPQPMDVWNPKVPQFPPGTELALLRKLILPDQDGHLRLTPVTESVQIRHYTDIPNVNPMASRDLDLARHFQAPSELDLSRTLLFSEHRSGLRGVTATDDPFLILPARSSGVDIFENESVFEDWQRMREGHTLSPFVECTSCHLGPGIQSMMSFSFRGSPSEGPVLSPRLAETTPNAEAKKVLQWTQTQQKWKDLLQMRFSRKARF